MFKSKITFKFEKMDKWTKKMVKALDEGLNDTADEVANIADRKVLNEAFDTGFLAQSLTVDKKTKLSKTVEYTAPYSPFIEFGTDPHWPPVMRIYEWVLRHTAELGIERGEVFKTKNDGYVYENVWKVAWGISKKISEEGSEPKPFFRPAIEEGRDKMYGFVKKRIEAIK